MVEVILCKDIHNVGMVGDVLKVKEGYARNYLLPQKMAYLATPTNLRRIEQQKVRIARDLQLKKSQAEELAEKLGKVSCTLTVEVNDLDRLYGSVTEVDIVRALDAEGFTVDKKDIILEKPIEELGIFEVGVKLHPEVTTKIRIWVAKK